MLDFAMNVLAYLVSVILVVGALYLANHDLVARAEKVNYNIKLYWRKLMDSTNPIPTIGRIVHYQLSADDATQINRRRTTGQSISDRLRAYVDSAGGPVANIYGWPAGAQAHIGNDVKEGDVFPMLIVCVWGPTATSAVNGQVFLDGTDVLWVPSVMVGEGPRTFSWPARS